MKNWAGNVTFRAARVVTPRSVEEMQAAVAEASANGLRVGVIGAGHSFSRIADTDGVLISTERLDAIGDVAVADQAVTIEAGVGLAALGASLHRQGWALHNLPSLSHLTFVGAVATGTHGSGDTNRYLGASVSAIEVIRPTGELERVTRGDPAFEATVVGLGVMGIVARLVIDLVPTFDIAQSVFIDLDLDVGIDHLDEILACGYSVSLFTEWSDDRFSQVWVKRRPEDSFDASALQGADQARRPMHPVTDMDATACTDQFGVSGPWHERLPHFRPDRQPSVGAELQSEFFVARVDAPAALTALRSLQPLLAPLVMVCEVRSVAADDHWLSMAYRRDSVALHFTWLPDPVRVTAVLERVEEVLAPFAPRPHWGKLTTMSGRTIRSSYDRFDDVLRLQLSADPDGTFLNDHVRDLTAG